MKHRILFMMAVLSVGFSFPETRASSDVEDARANAAINLKSKDGMAFTDTASALFIKNHPKTIKNCRDSLKAPDTTRFDVFFKLSRRGMIKDAFLSPVTTMGECLLNESRNDNFPPPPGPNYWISINSSIIPK